MTNNKKLTAVEWLFNELERIDKVYYRNTIIYTDARKEAYEKAKEMEKERMIDFANNCIKQIEVSDTCELLMVESPKDLYKQTYGGGEQ
jgi:hypothetical protein